MTTTVQFKTSWSGYEFGTITALNDSLAAALISGGIATAYAGPGFGKSDIAATLRFAADGTVLGIVSKTPSGAETIIPIDSSAAVPVPSAAGQVLTSQSAVPGDYVWQAPASSGGGGGGGGAAVRRADSTNYVLDTLAPGAAMPNPAGLTHVVSARTITHSVDMENAMHTADYLLAAALDLSSFSAVAGSSNNAIGNKVRVTASVFGGIPTAVVTLLGAADVTAPVPGNGAAANGSTDLVIPITEQGTPAFGPGKTYANVHLTFTSGAAKTLTAGAISGGNMHLTLSSALAFGDVLTYAMDAGTLVDQDGNASIAYSGVSITNGAVIPAPGAPTVAAGTGGNAPTTTSLKGTITDGSGGLAATFQVYYRLGSSSGAYTTGPVVTRTGSSTPFSIDGLTAGTGDAYSVHATATNGTSTSANSADATITLAANTVSGNLAFSSELALADGTTVPVSTMSNYAVFKVDGNLKGGTATSRVDISDPTLTNYTEQTGAAVPGSLGLKDDVSNSAFQMVGVSTDPTQDSSIEVTVPAKATSQQLIVSAWVGASGGDSTYIASGMLLTATLMDASHSPVSVHLLPDASNQYASIERAFHLDFNGAAATSLKLKLTNPANHGGDYFGLHIVAIG